MMDQVLAVNATAYDQLGTVMDGATTALATLNSTVATALAAADAVPGNILDPFTDSLDKVLAVTDTMASTVSDNLATVQDAVTDAQSTLSTVYSLSDTLVAAVTEAQCAGACGAVPDECSSS